ncbi:MAG: gene transfer agent family protein [Pseudomonadota bacterium]
MANPWAGEVELVIDGRRQVLRLTLGALAELEADLGAETLFNLIERFETGNVRARDVLALIAAGLRGGGWSGRSSDLVAAEIEGGAVEAARVAGQLLVRAFEMPKQG